MRPRDIPTLLDALFEVRKSGIQPPTPLIVAMDGAGKNETIAAYCRKRGIQLAEVAMCQAESAGDIVGIMARRELLPCPACMQQDALCPDRYAEADWVRHVEDQHKQPASSMRPALESLRAFVQTASHFLQPSDLPTSGQGVMVVDEYNRANGMVENVALELVGKHRIRKNGWQLPPGWVMVALANPPTEQFTGVNIMDAASESRVVVLTMVPEREDFLDYAREANLDRSVIRFVETQTACLDAMRFDNPLIKGIVPKPRRLTTLSHLAKVLRAKDKDLLMECAEGLVGPDYAQAYGAVLEEDDGPIDADVILGNYAKAKADIAALLAGNRLDAIDGTINNVLAHLQQLGKAPPKKQLGNLCKFVVDLPAEAMLKFLTTCTRAKHGSGEAATYAALRDGFPQFSERVMHVMDQGVDLLPAVAA